MRKIFLIGLLILGVIANAQPPNKFFARFGGNGIDIGYGAQEIYNRQYIVVGSTTSFGNGASDAYLFLVDSMGQLVWQKTFGGTGSELGKNVLINPADSGFVFSGYTNSYGNGGFDVYVVRTDKSGNLKWQASFGGLDWDFGNDLSFSADGNLIVCGNSYSSMYGNMDGYLLKVNINNGNLIWDKKYGGPQDDEFKSIKLTSDGNYSIAGNTKSYGDINGDFWFFKVNNNGDSLTSNRLGAQNKQERCYDFVEDISNNLVFCGAYDTSFSNSGKNVAYIIKTGLNGTFLSDAKFPGAYTNDDKFNSVALSKSGNEYFFSRKVQYNGPVFGIEIQPIMLDYNYSFLNSTTYGGAGDDESYKVIHTKDNGFLMAGYTNGFGSISTDAFVIKLDYSLLSSSLTVGVIENKTTQNQEREIYYYDNAIHIQNPNNELITFQIIDLTGKVIEAGRTRGTSISINPETEKGIYFFRAVGDIDAKTKFIKY